MKRIVICSKHTTQYGKKTKPYWVVKEEIASDEAISDDNISAIWLESKLLHTIKACLNTACNSMDKSCLKLDRFELEIVELSKHKFVSKGDVYEDDILSITKIA